MLFSTCLFFPTILLLSSHIHSSIAHTLFTNILVDGLDQGLGTCMRLPLYPNNATFPQPDITAPSMTCGFNGNTGVARTCPVQPGSTVTLQFRDHPDASAPGSIDPSHKGPCAAYMKKVDDATKNGTGAANGSGDDSATGWFRIFYSDYDESTQKWCTETLITNNGLLSVKLPQSLPAGDYLLRGELLALHQADKTPPDPQFYIGCAQIWMNGTAGSSSLSQKTQLPGSSDTVAIPGYVNLSMPAMTFNIWQTPMKLPYPGYGPAVYQDPIASTPSTSGKRKRATTPPQQTSGLRPQNCVLAVANWCGTEVASYSTQQGCWNASAECYKQEDACWKAAGPTGGKGCKVWETKCQGIQDGCKAGNYNGPPDMGKKLDETPQKVAVPAMGQMFGVQRVGGVVGGGGGGGAGGTSAGGQQTTAGAYGGGSGSLASSPSSTVVSAAPSAPAMASAPTYPISSINIDTTAAVSTSIINAAPASETSAPPSSLSPTTLTVIAIPLSSSSSSASIASTQTYLSSSSPSGTSTPAASTSITTSGTTSYDTKSNDHPSSGSNLDQENNHSHDHQDSSASSSSSPTQSAQSSPSSSATSSSQTPAWDTNAQFLAAAEILSEAYGSTGDGPSAFSLLEGSDGAGGGRRHGRSWGGALGRCGPAAAGTGNAKRDGNGDGGSKCAIGLCCSQFGFCGTGVGYCGSGCLKGFGVCS